MFGARGGGAFHFAIEPAVDAFHHLRGEIAFSGEHGSFAGLDQINLKVPRSLAGRGEVAVRATVDGAVANLVRVSFK